jgi:20S proteasome subunit beta 2
VGNGRNTKKTSINYLSVVSIHSPSSTYTCKNRNSIMSEFTCSIPIGNIPSAGFDFENVTRNRMIGNMQGADMLPKPMKTGTTIVGVVYKDGVILGADTRATSDTEVAEKNCEKIHYMAPNLYCCGAGTAADTEKITDLISSELELLRMNTHSNSRVTTACTLLKRRLYRYQGQISAALILGGCDINGPAIYQIAPHGSTAKLSYTTMGSGSLASMAVMESSWHEDMTEAEATQLVQRAVGAGVFNDLGSGSNIDICVIRTDGSVDYRKNDVKPNETAPLRNSVQHSERLTMKYGLTPTLGNPVIQVHPKMLSLADVTVTEMEVESV